MEFNSIQRTFTRWFATVVMIVGIGLYGTMVFAAAPGVNLIPNPTFAQDDEGWRTQLHRGNPDDVVFAIDHTVGRTDTRSATIVSQNPAVYGKWFFRYEPEQGVLKQGQTYRAEVWYKTEDHLGLGVPPNIQIRVASHSEGWAEYHGAFLQVVGVSEDGWTLVAGEITLPQSQPWNMLFDLMLHEWAGTVWFDDAKLVLVSED